MTDAERLAFNLLKSFNFAILRRVAPREYVFFGEAPAFYKAIFPGCSAGEICTAPWECSSMMDYFLDEAEDYFASGEVGSISSSVWEEDGLTWENSALKAIATNLGDAQIIIICLLQEDYVERLGILRTAREQLHENRVLTTTLSVFREKSRIDGLTCIFNRTTFMELLLDEIKRSQILDYPLVLLIMDIDDFKKVNDNYGHLIGDEILKGMGTTLKHNLRRNDIVARYGGEEFAVLIPHAPLDEGMQVAEKIRLALADMVIPDSPRITISVGCTAYAPDEAAECFFKRADEALYAAKKSGKNRVVVQ